MIHHATLPLLFGVGLLMAARPMDHRIEPEQRPTVTLRLFHAEPILGGVRVTMRFRNWTHHSQTVFFPGDGSFDDRQPPYYRLQAVDRHGNVLTPNCSGCRPTALPPGAIWPREYTIILPPESTFAFEEEIHLAYKERGMFLLRCQYEMSSEASRHGVGVRGLRGVWFGRTNWGETSVILPEPW
jgi:hypothetical protein